jgi:zinc D-Ala-D-Ala carboxypeptidase
MKLTQNFTLQELINSETATRYGIQNHPDPDVYERLATITAPGMEQVRTALNDKPIIVTSGYRSEALEQIIARRDFEAWCAGRGLRVGAASWDEYFARKGHPKGYCVDFICPQFGAPRAIVQRIVNAGIRFDQCIEEGTWVHISFDPAARQLVMTARFDSMGRPTYTNGLT